MGGGAADSVCASKSETILVAAEIDKVKHILSIAEGQRLA